MTRGKKRKIGPSIGRFVSKKERISKLWLHFKPGINTFVIAPSQCAKVTFLWNVFVSPLKLDSFMFF